MGEGLGKEEEKFSSGGWWRCCSTTSPVRCPSLLLLVRILPQVWIVVSARGGGSIQVAAGDLIPVCPSAPVTQGALHVQQEKKIVLFFYSENHLMCF